MTNRIGPYELNQIYTGDTKVLAEEIPDESVDLIFTDPVYQNIGDYRWLAETAARVLKPSGNLLVYVTQEHLPHQIGAMTPFLLWGWLFGIQLFGRRAAMWQKKVQACGQLIAWLARSPQFAHPTWAADFLGVQARQSKGHSWRKGLEETAHYLSAFSDSNDVIVDFFTGGGTVPAICKMTHRNYVAFEINPATADLARERVARTQLPLFVLVPEQIEMEIAI